jgi:hypothetical protein
VTAHPVNKHFRAVVGLNSHAGGFVIAWSNYVDFVAMPYKPGSESLGKPSRSIYVWGEGIARNHNLHMRN